MILHRVTLENVGVYRGRHTIDLTPPDAEHPVILVGAMNGAGKTTLLGAVQLALYGSRARGIERTRKGYKTHLKELIKRDLAVVILIDHAEGAKERCVVNRRAVNLPRVSISSALVFPTSSTRVGEPLSTTSHRKVTAAKSVG